MKLWVLLLMLTTLMFGCKNEMDDCPTIWELDVHELASSATVDSSGLTLTTWNSISNNSLELSQTGLIGDFEVSINLTQFQWDSLVYPQFRLEVFNPSSPNTDLCGVAVNPTAFYCYVGAATENRDLRLISEQTGSLRITRQSNAVTCSGHFGEISLSYSDTLHSSEMGVRLVLGVTEASVGKLSATLRNFKVSKGGSVMDDSFECASW